MRFKERRLIGTALLGIITSSTPFLALADERALEEVVVTATGRQETLQEVPISVSVVSSEQISSIGAFRMQDLSGVIPNVIIEETVISNSLSVRGISSTNNQGFEQSVGLFRDGVYIGKGHLSRLPFMDLERIEVLRGPQGTLFGKNTIAGAVSSISKSPTDEFEAAVRTQVAIDSDSDYEFGGYVSGPFADNVRGRLAARYRDSDGYLTNTANGNRTEPQRDEYAVRGALAIDLTDTLMAVIKYEHAEWERDGRSMQIAGTRNPLVYQDSEVDDTSSITNTSGQANLNGTPFEGLDGFTGFDGTDREREYSDSDADIASVKITGSVGEYTFESNTGYAAYTTDEFFDGEYGPLPQITNVADEDYEQFSQELRLLSPSDEPITWILGIYYENNDYEFNEQIDVAIPPTQFTKFVTSFEQDEEDIAIFGTLSYDISSAITATGGFRYNVIEKDADQGQYISPILPAGNTEVLDPLDPANAPIFGFWGFLGIEPHFQSDDRSTNFLEWTVNLEYAFRAVGDHSTYLTVSEGSKSGGFDARATSESPFFEFDDEEARTYEIGLKSSWLDDKLLWNWAIFRTEYTDLQQSIFNGALSFIVQNAAEATINGLETDLNWRVAEYVTLSGSLGWLDFEYDDYPQGPCTVDQAAAVQPPCYQDLGGEAAPRAPELNGSIAYDFNMAINSYLNVYSTATLVYSDEYFQDTDLDVNTLEDSFTKIDMTIGIESNDGIWSVGILGKNLTDETNCSHRGDTPLNAGTYSCLTNPPRTYYLQANYRF